jgi:hypothetical protein
MALGWLVTADKKMIASPVRLAAEIAMVPSWRANRIGQRATRDGVRRPLMRWFVQQIRVRPTQQHLIAMLLIVSIVAALLPVPRLPASPVSTKDRSQPFPCQDRPCGCRSAEQCRKKCCCFTPAQKLAWAKRNGAASFFSQLSAKSVADAKCETDKHAVLKGCCTAPRSAESKANGAVATVRSKAASSTRATSGHAVVIGVFAQECQGIDRSMASQMIFIVPPDVTLATVMEVICERVILVDVRFDPRAPEPPVPPPRLVAV